MPTSTHNEAPSAESPGAPPRGGAARPAFRANDVVFYVPTGRDWVLAADERDGQVVGPDDGLVCTADVDLVRVTTDDGRLLRLKNVAEGCEGLAARWAREDLQREGITAPAPRQGSLF